MTVAAILRSKNTEIVSVSSDQRVADVVTLLAQRRIGAVPVTDGGLLVGIFSERDVIYRFASDGAAVLDRTIGEVMTSPAVTVSPDTPLLSALGLMTRRRVRHLPVMEGNALVGFISIGDIVKIRIDRIEAEAEAMRQYIAGNEGSLPGS